MNAEDAVARMMVGCLVVVDVEVVAKLAGVVVLMVEIRSLSSVLRRLVTAAAASLHGTTSTFCLSALRIVKLSGEVMAVGIRSQSSATHRK